jgi:hypothetical protein
MAESVFASSALNPNLTPSNRERFDDASAVAIT